MMSEGPKHQFKPFVKSGLTRQSHIVYMNNQSIKPKGTGFRQKY